MSESDLDRAIEANDIAEVKRLVEAGADLKHMGAYDATPLANAAYYGHIEIVKYLLNAGANPAFGGCRAVLGDPCGLGFYDVCVALLDGGADPNETDMEGENCVSMAIFKGDLKILKLLVERGASIEPFEENLNYANELNEDGSHDEVIAYLKAMNEEIRKAADEPPLPKRIRDLIDAGDSAAIREAASAIDLNRPCSDSGECPLSAAVSVGSPEVVRLLIELGADPGYRKTGTPPLVAAARSGSIETLTALLDAGAKVDVRDEEGFTPLMEAAASGHVEIVNELLRRGANPKLESQYGTTPLGRAVHNKQYEVCDILAPASPRGEREKLKIVLEIKSQRTAESHVDALIHAATYGEFETVRDLLEGGLSVDTLNPRGTTPLMRAALGGEMEIVQWLLDRGADVNRKDLDEEWPLTYTVIGRHPEMFDFLYPLTNEKLRPRAEKMKEEQIACMNWPEDPAQDIETS